MLLDNEIPSLYGAEPDRIAKTEPLIICEGDKKTAIPRNRLS